MPSVGPRGVARTRAARLLCFRYGVGGCVPQSAFPEPGAFVTCARPVPSTLTV